MIFQLAPYASCWSVSMTFTGPEMTGGMRVCDCSDTASFRLAVLPFLTMFIVERGQDFFAELLFSLFRYWAFPDPPSVYTFPDRGIYLSLFFLGHLRVPLGHFQLLRIAPSASSIYVRPIRSPTAFQPRPGLSTPCYPLPHLFPTPNTSSFISKSYFFFHWWTSCAMTPLKINSFGVPKMKAVI